MPNRNASSLQVYKKFLRSHEVVFFGVSKKVYVAKLQRKLFGIYRSHDTQREAHDMARNVCSEEREILLSMIKRFCKSHNNIGPETAEKCSCISRLPG